MKPESKNFSDKKVKVITFIFLLLALISPIYIQIQIISPSYSILIPSILFGITIGEDHISLLPMGIQFLVPAMILLLPRIIAPIQIHRYYKGSSTKRNTIIAGIISESTGFLISLSLIPSALIMANVAIPTPLILVSCILILIFLPLPEPTTPWKESRPSEKWLDEKK